MTIEEIIEALFGVADHYGFDPKTRAAAQFAAFYLKSNIDDARLASLK